MPANSEEEEAFISSAEALTPTHTASRRDGPTRTSRSRPKPKKVEAFDQTAAEGEWLQIPVEDEELDLQALEDGLSAPDDPLKPMKHYVKPVSISDIVSSRSVSNYKRRIRPANIPNPTSHDMRLAVCNYSDKFQKLLSLEEAEDEAALKDRLAQWSLTRLQEEGYCVTGLGAYWLEANQFGRPVAAFSLGPGILLPENKFENGTQVLISRLDPLKEDPVTGSILSRSQTQLRVCFSNQFDLDTGTWRLDLGRPNLIYNRMRTAINQLETDPVAVMNAVPPQRSAEYIVEGTQLRDIILRSFMPQPGETDADSKEVGTSSAVDPVSNEGIFKDDERIQSWARRYSRSDPVVLEDDPPLDGLNSSQKKAMAAMIGERFSLIQGPPGTGKTKTIIETVKLLKGHFKTPHPLLICTYTNVAVDNLVDGLVKAGVNPLRVGYHGSIRDSLISHTLDYKLEQHHLSGSLKKYADEAASIPSKIDELTKKCDDLEEKILSSRGPRKASVQRMANMKDALVKMEIRQKFLKTRIFSTQQKMLRDVVTSADVICTTCITAACHALNIIDLPIVFIDEASMSTEPASLIPLMKGSQHVSLIGDHKQLPPVIISHQAKEEGFGISLFERLIEEGHVPSVMLDIQYRMHPNISRFPAKEFYDLALLDGTVDAGGKALPGLEPLNSKHTGHHKHTHRPSVIFLDHAGPETYHGRSLQNITEADIVASVIEDLLLNNPHLKGQDIGIIAPYVAQIRLLTRLLNTDAEYRKRFRHVLGDRASEVASIEIKTVDGFEGREKEVIVFSTVRNNQSGHIGFLADKKRLNVGLTRAKRGLFVVGSLATLREGKLRMTQSTAVVGKGAESWRRYADYLMEGDLVVTLTGSALTRALYDHLEVANKRVVTTDEPLLKMQA
ncbi:P-loop containing nucleoside triphosphate hydrolase protein [Pholiota conissans]|uniref:P-loop containing nucleoside triphosphate hydrolase protein n=1 Tax=Pholiota conissans TaxID=109636 RepID=A0A9P5Z5D5_9AGAR|nr:P-loop containing nucleoside triphosphate hydrolase protein [Pholiota conissans]